MSDLPPAPLLRRGDRRLAIGAALAFLLATFGSMMIGRSASPRPGWPDPNGYEELAKAGSLMQGKLPNQGDLDKADPAEIRLFIASNQAVLDQVRIGLGHESIAPLEDSQEGLTAQSDRAVRIKTAAWVLRAEGLVAETDGRFADALRSYRDILGVGQAITQGAMLGDARLGWFVQKVGIGRLRKLRNHLSVEDARRAIRDLESFDGRLVAPQTVVDRWERWYRGAFPSYQRAIMRWNGIEATERVNQKTQAVKGHDEAARSLRFLRIELAIHAHHLEKGTWPRSVKELVPAYLASVPIDPATDQPLDYPANPQGELTDDLGTIARPDGEVGGEKGVRNL
jgi:hypothetical protein